MVWELYVPVWKSRYMRFIISLETCPTETEEKLVFLLPVWKIYPFWEN
jgi:hypothetical protein